MTTARTLAATLAELRLIGSPQALVERACRVALEDGALRRVTVNSVDGARRRRVASAGEPLGDPTADLLDARLERRVVEERAPAVATGADAGALLPGSTSAAIVPVPSPSRVLALVHADGGPDGPPLTNATVDRLWLLALAVGPLLEVALLRDRLAEQRAEVDRAVDRLAAVRLEEDRVPEPLEVEALTQRERDVLALLLRGLDNRTIAAQLLISTGTVKSHVKQILRKLRVSSRAEAIARCRAGALPSP
jgi:LuxR family transcriptional regulator, regulator of acetate metabolism